MRSKASDVGAAGPSPARGRPRFALVSHALPPSWSGQSVVLWKLLRDLPPEGYVLVSSRPVSGAGGESGFIPRLPAPVQALPREPDLAWLERFRLGAPARTVEAALRLSLRGRRIARIARETGCAALVACSGDLLDLPATWRAARRLGLPFHAYLFDDYTFQWADPRKRALAAWFERRMLRDAAGVVVPNEFLAEEIRRRHGVACTIVRNAVELEPEHGLDAPWPATPGEVRILYTGAVYHAHYDAFRNLVDALGKLGRPEVRLHVYTTQDPAALEAEGIRGPVVFHPHVPSDESRALQRRADVLFLPLAFASAIPEVIRTSAPGKTGEYLASGRPVLVHAPAGSWPSWYFAAHDCGVVVDAPDPARLAAGLRTLLDDPARRRAVAAHALARARDDFALERARAAFLGLVAPAP